MKSGFFGHYKNAIGLVSVRRARGVGCALLAGLIVWLAITGDAPWNSNAALAAEIPESSPVIATADQSGSAKPVIAINFDKILGKLPRNAFGIWLGNSGHERPDPMYLYRSTEGRAKLAEIGPRNLFYSTDQDLWSAAYDPFSAKLRSFPDWMDTDEYVNLNAGMKSAPILAANITIQCVQADVNLPPSSANVSCKKSKASDATAWIKYLKTKNAPVKYVVMGMEPYAGCLYWNKGINCTDKAGRHRVALPQEEYAARVVQWAKKLKKANPKVRIGAHLQPNTFLCKKTITLAEHATDTDDIDLSSEAAAATCGGKSWDQTVMQLAGDSIDFFVVHQYFIIRKHAADEVEAQKLSYYQEQINMRVQKNGVSAFPSQIRKELNQWLPAKIGAPIVVAEFNASYIDKVPDEEKYKSRQSIYTAMALGELFLDLLKPVNTPQGKQPGATNTVLLGMFAPQLTLTRMINPQDPNSMIYMPSWHVMSMLKALPGKTLIRAKIKKNLKTAVNRSALSVTAVKKGKNVWIAVFNHHNKTVKADVTFAGVNPLSGTATVLGQSATGFLGMNDESAPNAITPETKAIRASKFQQGVLKGRKFPAHTLTLLQIAGQ